MGNQNSYKQFKHLAVVMFGVILMLFAVAVVLSFIFSDTRETICLLLLFGLPILVQCGGLWSLDGKWERAHQTLSSVNEKSKPRGKGGSPDQIKSVVASKRQEAEGLVAYSQFYLYNMALCLFVYNLLWLVYGIGQGVYRWEENKYEFASMHRFSYVAFVILSPVALIAIAALLFMVAWLTRAVISGEVAPKSHTARPMDLFYLRLGAAQAPFLTLIFFLTVFLGVSYLFGFALAFHDKTTNPKMPALVAKNLIIPDANLPSNPLPSPTTKPIAIPPDLASPVGVFMFESGVALPTSYDSQLDEATAAIRKRADQDNPVRITVVGSADLSQITSPAYQSNYELAEARALYVKRLLVEKLSTSGDINVLHNLDWTCLPRPKEGKRDSGLKPRQNADREADEDRRVEVFAQQQFETPVSLLVRHLRANHVNPLSLMDYVYFANYTVTTTGYGDIIPNSPFTKFICSFANIVEVFFLVVFFNTLLSLVGRKSHERLASQINDLHDKHGPQERRGA